MSRFKDNNGCLILAVVEGVLKDFPRLIVDKNNLSEFLVNSAAFPVSASGSCSELGVAVHGGRKRFQQERFAEAPQQRFLHTLEHVVIVVSNGYAQLTQAEAAAVKLTCWDGMSLSSAAEQLECSERWIADLRKRAFTKMKGCCMEVLSDVEVWRKWVKNTEDSCLMKECF